MKTEEKTIFDLNIFEKDRPKDIFDTDLSIHFLEFDAIYKKFWETLTFEKAKTLLQIIIAYGGSTPLYIEKLIYRSDFYCKRFKDFINKDNKNEN